MLPHLDILPLSLEESLLPGCPVLGHLQQRAAGGKNQGRRLEERGRKMYQGFGGRRKKVYQGLARITDMEDEVLKCWREETEMEDNALIYWGEE